METRLPLCLPSKVVYDELELLLHHILHYLYRHCHNHHFTPLAVASILAFATYVMQLYTPAMQLAQACVQLTPSGLHHCNFSRSITENVALLLVIVICTMHNIQLPVHM